MKNNNVLIYAAALALKVVQWFHMMPGCEMANYGSWPRFWFAVKARKHISAHFGHMS
ncbi:MAG: hypothetical protein LBL94_07565 [Prevotellaceae bacterium]|jgi:hypothetical protein|nr:hypothetical protein [Prevotellaceae bacterium]